MIKLENLEIAFGDRTILEGANWVLGDHAHVGLVGENGSGKTTLLRAVAGLIEPDRGRIEGARNLEVGYLPQHGVELSGNSLEEEIRLAVKPLLDLQKEQEAIEEKLSSDGLSEAEQESLIRRMTELGDRFHIRGGYEIEGRIGRILSGLGFREEDRSKPLSFFSGGWQMRIALAKLLLSQPQVLLLDEPTNHLDLEARNWLEEFLKDYPAAWMLVSHDRYFLDVTTQSILEIEDGVLTPYQGNYTAYLEKKKNKLQQEQKEYEKYLDYVARQKAFINKYKADKKRAAQVQSRIKMLDKLEPVEPPRQSKTINIDFPAPPPAPSELLRLSKVNKSYGDTAVLENVDLVIFKGEKIAVLGPNGSGKSTLLRIMAGREEPDNGDRHQSPRTVMDFFHQGAGDELEHGLTALDTLSRTAPLESVPRIRNILGAFLFSGEDQDQKVEELSGGEKSRLAMAKLMLTPANLILLDEPTNHLDLASKEVLHNAIKNYDGAVVYVTHDRYFLENIPDRVLEVRDKAVSSYPGDYNDFVRGREGQREGKSQDNLSKAFNATGSGTGKESKSVRIRKKEEDKKRQRRRQKLEKRRSAVEESIAEKEAELSALESRMADPEVSSDYQKLLELEKNKRSLTSELERLYNEWESLEQKPEPEE
ncbi:MAG: ABC-F family ATP-binding cassette domain-containing protein [bacterium]